MEIHPALLAVAVAPSNLEIDPALLAAAVAPEAA
jgi:hypothetical protein